MILHIKTYKDDIATVCKINIRDIQSVSDNIYSTQIYNIENCSVFNLEFHILLKSGSSVTVIQKLGSRLHEYYLQIVREKFPKSLFDCSINYQTILNMFCKTEIYLQKRKEFEVRKTKLSELVANFKEEIVII